MLENADGAEDVADNLDLVGEVAGVAEDHLGAGLELHLGLDTGHGGLDADGLAVLVDELVNVGVEHVGTAVDGGKTGEALGKLAKAVERVDVWRLAVAGDGLAVEADALDGLRGGARGIEVVVVEVEGHGVADEILGAGLEAELVKDLLHGAGVHIEA